MSGTLCEPTLRKFASPQGPCASTWTWRNTCPERIRNGVYTCPSGWLISCVFMALTIPQSKQHSLVSPASIHSPVDWEGRTDPLQGMVSFLQWKSPSKSPHRPTVWTHSMHTVKLVYAQRWVIPQHSPHQISLRRPLPSKLPGKATLQVTSHQHSFLSVWSRFVCKYFQRGQSLIPWWWSEHQSCSEIRNWDRLIIGHGSRLRLT